MMARNTKHIWWQKGYKRWLPYCIYVSMESWSRKVFCFGMNQNQT